MDYLSLLSLLFACLAAGLAGFVDAIAGGGGIICIPALLMLGLPPSQAVGTNKLISSSGTLVATLTFLKTGVIERDILNVSLLLSALGALLGALCASSMPQEIFKPLIAVFIFGAALYFFFKPQLGLTRTYSGLSFRLGILCALAAFLLGFYDGVFGPGTGAFLTFFMVRGLGLDLLSANGNTKALNLMSNVVALGFFLWKQEVLFGIGIPMAIANIIGNYIGAHHALRKGSAWIRWLYMTMAFLIGIKLLLDMRG